MPVAEAGLGCNVLKNNGPAFHEASRGNDAVLTIELRFPGSAGGHT
jgi:hypothetical protein